MFPVLSCVSIAGSLLAIMFVLIMASLISLLTAEDPMSNFQNIMFLQTQILVFFICTNLVLIILTGSTSNGAFQSHRYVLCVGIFFLYR